MVVDGYRQFAVRRKAGEAEAAKQEAADFRRGFPDVISVIEDLIAEGDKVVARWRSRATHQGDYMGIPQTGNRVEFTGITVYRIEGGKIAQSWNIEDQFGLMRQTRLASPLAAYISMPPSESS